jgi:hypothetical protein
MKKKTKKLALKATKKHPVVAQQWEESERGWGVRPDGASLHLTEEDRISYCKDHWNREKKLNSSGIVPDEYSRERGQPLVIDVDAKIYKLIKESKYGIMLWQHEWNDILQGRNV